MKRKLVEEKKQRDEQQPPEEPSKAPKLSPEELKTLQKKKQQEHVRELR